MNNGVGVKNSTSTTVVTPSGLESTLTNNKTFTIDSKVITETELLVGKNGSGVYVNTTSVETSNSSTTAVSLGAKIEGEVEVSGLSLTGGASLDVNIYNEKKKK